MNQNGTQVSLLWKLQSNSRRRIKQHLGFGVAGAGFAEAKDASWRL